MLLAAAPLGGVFPLYFGCLTFWCLEVGVQGDSQQCWLPETDVRVEGGFATLLPLKILGKERPHIFTQSGPGRKQSSMEGLSAESDSQRRIQKQLDLSLKPELPPVELCSGPRPPAFSLRAGNLRLFAKRSSGPLSILQTWAQDLHFSFEIELRFSSVSTARVSLGQGWGLIHPFIQTSWANTCNMGHMAGTY